MTSGTTLTDNPTPGPVQTLQVDRLEVQVYADRGALGAAAAAVVASSMRTALDKRENIRMAFAAAPSQEEFLAALAATPDLDWSRVTAFQLDDYVGPPSDAPQRFSTFLCARLFDKVNTGQIHLIGAIPTADEALAECDRYAALIGAAPLDIVCLGIGENGHLAFNDPPVADFHDPAAVKLVELDEPCRRQQVNDGCFPAIEHVPTHAITLTIPTLLSGRRLVCVVPGPAKREAVRRTLTGPIETACPASILRTHPDCTLYLDRQSYDG
jgi:glucosamine-6-phosphate deaminase